MTARFSIFNALVKHSYQVINARAVNYHQIFNEEAIDRIPPAVQYSWPWV